MPRYGAKESHQLSILSGGFSSPAAPRLEIPRLITTWQKQHILFPYALTFAVLSFDHLVRPVQHRLRNCEADLLRRLKINHQLELRWLLHRNISRLPAL